LNIAVFDGDGIGPEIMALTLSILQKIGGESVAYDLTFTSLPAGAAHYAKTGESLPKSSLQATSAADAILLSAMGLPTARYADGTEISPQIDLRKAFKLFADVGPVRVGSGAAFPAENFPRPRD
jgi:3-isopropylmalate dehydrogenase